MTLRILTAALCACALLLAISACHRPSPDCSDGYTLCRPPWAHLCSNGYRCSNESGVPKCECLPVDSGDDEGLE